eukprot:3152230-Pleurochrysis_carterae.AAC.1
MRSLTTRSSTTRSLARSLTAHVEEVEEVGETTRLLSEDSVRPVCMAWSVVLDTQAAAERG